MPHSARDPASWPRVKALFLQALEQPETERTAFVQRSCGADTELRDEILSLLASEQAASGFGETPAAGLLAMEAPLDREPSRLEPGTRLGVYEVTGFLSAGGMGEVYRARHTLLGRIVAIKTLNPSLADAAARRRLIREARHAAVLSHPNICTIYEVGETDGKPFIVMALVAGKPLNEILRSRVPTLDQALDYGVQIADALEHAHRHGIVHRDLKSSNVVLDTAGRPIVLDFGLAKRLPERDAAPADSTATGQGALAGTLSHMAPEVLLGGPADVRSDVWSLGVLLYELCTGTLPFTGRTPFETSSAILNEPLRPMPRAVPLAVRLVIERCLVKDPDSRYQRAADVRNALDAIRRRHAWPLVGRLLVTARRRTLYVSAAVVVLVVLAASVGPGAWRRLAGVPNARIATLAFLPLENATHDPAFDYYAAGLTEGLIAQLGEATGVRVITTTSNTDSLGADAVVSGRLRRAGERVAVDARLIERASGRVLWSDTFERTADQTLALQADVVRALAGAVRLAVRPGAADRLATVRAVSPQAYEEYLKGRYEWNRRTQASLQRALAHFQAAIALDPTYAPAYAALADCYNQFGTVLVGTGSPLRYRPLAAAAAIHALQIDPYSAEAHATLGYAEHYDLRWADAERELRRAIELNPSYAMAHVWYANLLMSRGRMDDALVEVQLARALDPFSLIVNANVGWVLTYAGRPAEAIEHLRWTLGLDSTYVQTRVRLVGAFMAAQRYGDAHDEAERLVRRTSRAPAMVAALASADVALGQRAAARALLAELVTRGRTSYVPPAPIAHVFARLGDRDKAVAWITRAFEERSNAIAYLAVDPGNAMMRDDPRFQALLARAGLP